VIQAAENISGGLQRLTTEVQMIHRVCATLDNPYFVREYGLQGVKEKLAHEARTL
jgi:hypothetical protein